jgi:hypothetical protein
MTFASAALFAAVFTRALTGVDSLDPVQSQSTYDSHAVHLLYETPLEVDYRARPYRIKPGACELLGVSDDGGLIFLKDGRADPEIIRTGEVSVRKK